MRYAMITQRRISVIICDTEYDAPSFNDRDTRHRFNFSDSEIVFFFCRVKKSNFFNFSKCILEFWKLRFSSLDNTIQYKPYSYFLPLYSIEKPARSKKEE